MRVEAVADANRQLINFLSLLCDYCLFFSGDGLGFSYNLATEFARLLSKVWLQKGLVQKLGAVSSKNNIYFR